MGSNISNMKQAVFEMFGVGSGTEQEFLPTEPEVIEEALAPVQETSVVEIPPAAPVAMPVSVPVTSATMSYFAAGTVFEGTMHSDGDVEVAGAFKGDLDAKGTVKLYASLEGNVSAGSLVVEGCTLTGDSVVAGMLSVGEKAEIHGDVRTKDIHCAGSIKGGVVVSGNATLTRTAKVRGNISTGSFAVEKGATICGGLEIKGREER